MARARENHSVQEIIAFVMLGAGTLLFLALISYNPADVPTWFPLSTVGRATRSAGNFIGPVGAMLACLAYSLFGVAAYLIAAMLLGVGGAKLLSPALRLTSRFLWCIAFVVSGACLAQLLGWPLIDANRLHIAGEGGWVGKWLGGTLFPNILGSVGSVIIFAGIYLVSMLLLAGLHPMDAYRAAGELSAGWGEWLKEWNDERAERRVEEEKAREKARKAAVKTARSENRKPAAASERPRTSLFDDEELGVPEEAEPPRPEPKIIDGTAPPPPRKPPEPKKGDPLAPMAALNCENYQLPAVDLLDDYDHENRSAADPEELLSLQSVVIETLAQFGIAVSPGDITRGPTITRYEVYPAKGVRVDKIVSLERDIARATRAERINILAPIPGKDTVGIEIANAKKQKVTLRELLESEDFHSTKARIPIALGKDVYGKTIIGDLAAMPHGLVAGTTGSGKSVCINAIIASILYKFTPEDLRFIMIDPKVVEMQIYNSLPHLVVPVVTDPKKVLLALRWAIDEMEKRYAIFAKTGVRNIASFNSRPKLKTQKELDAEREPDLFSSAAAAAIEGASPEGEAPFPLEGEEDPESLSAEERVTRMTTVRVPRESDLIIPEQMPFIVIIVDELADLMQTAPADVESAIARITQKARAAGIHMIIATQTPRADVITGVIKANVPSRIAFQVASALDSRVILDENGAERLLGQGDMLYRPPGTSRMVRAQGVLVTDDEIRRLVEYSSAQSEPAFESSIHDRLQGSSMDEDEEVSEEDEELVDKCIEVMRQEKKASTSLFQRRLRLGYTRAARILDILEMRGYVGPGEGAKPREILVDLDTI